MSKEIKLESGNTLLFEYASILKANRLTKLVRTEFVNSNIVKYMEVFDKVQGKEFDQLDKKTKDQAIAVMQAYTKLIDSNDNVQEAIIKCFDGCVYNGNPLTLDTFNAIEARIDFDEVCMHVMQENMEAFQKKTISP